MVGDDEIKQRLQQMREEAAETERRGTEIAGERDGKKTAILDKARETKQEAEEMMSTFLGDDADGLDGFEFLTMAEAGEVGHWAVLGKLNEKAGRGRGPRARRLGAADPGAPLPDRQGVLAHPRRLGGPLLRELSPSTGA